MLTRYIQNLVSSEEIPKGIKFDTWEQVESFFAEYSAQH